MQARHAGTMLGSDRSTIRTVLSSPALANLQFGLPLLNGNTRGQKAIRVIAST